MPTKTNVFMSWTGVTVTYGASPTTITLTEITDVQVLDQEGLEMWQADGHRFPTQSVAATATRGVTLMGGDVAKLAAMPRGVACTVVAILNDAHNGTGVGALTHTWTGAYLAEAPRSGKTNKFADSHATFHCVSSDGTTDPLTVVQA